MLCALGVLGLNNLFIFLPLCTHSHGPMPSVVPPHWWGWCVFTMTWGDVGWSFPWQTWMRCPRFTHQTGWDGLWKSPLMSPKLMSASARSYNSLCLQSIPENGAPEVPPPNVTSTHQSPPQAPASVPSQNSSPPVQPGGGPLSLSPQQVRMASVSKVCVIGMRGEAFRGAQMWTNVMIFGSFLTQPFSCN